MTDALNDPALPITRIDPGPWLDLLDARFGVAPAVLEGYVFFQRNQKYVAVMPAGHAPPVRPVPDTIGLNLIKRNLRYPKLTTPGAMLIGPSATQHVLMLDRPQAEAYLRRTPLSLSAEQAVRCISLGYVLVQHQSLTLGVGFFSPADGGTGGGRLASLFPRHWAGMHFPEAGGPLEGLR